MHDLKRLEQALAEGGSVVVGGRVITNPDELADARKALEKQQAANAPAPAAGKQPTPGEVLAEAPDDVLITAVEARGYKVETASEGGKKQPGGEKK
jgi:hypothetical protein